MATVTFQKCEEGHKGRAQTGFKTIYVKTDQKSITMHHLFYEIRLN